jgi:hypothetical protein
MCDFSTKFQMRGIRISFLFIKQYRHTMSFTSNNAKNMLRSKYIVASNSTSFTFLRRYLFFNN